MSEYPDQGDLFIRKGPSPLPLHLGLALESYSRVKDRVSADDPRLVQMIEGIKKYQDHPYRRKTDPLPVVWQKGGTSLFQCHARRNKGERRHPVFLLPSMINKSTILDLMPGRSFVRWLADQGHDVFLLDWGTPAGISFDDLFESYLCDAWDNASLHAGNTPALLGYCMGGVLAVALANFREPAALICLASPWDFHAGDRVLTDEILKNRSTALQKIESDSRLPASWIQSVFAAVNAEKAMEKFVSFAQQNPESESAKLFVAVEDWLNDGIDLPSSIARMCLEDWYHNNQPAKRQWTVCGMSVLGNRVECPTLIMASDRDRLVPKSSSLALADGMAKVDVIKPPCGHVGMMSSRRAISDTWQPLAHWLARNT